MKFNQVLRTLAFALLALAISLAGCQAQRAEGPASASAGTPVAAAEARQVTVERGIFARLARELKPSVVNIQVLKREPGISFPSPFPDDPLFRWFFHGIPTPQEPREVPAQGSGVIISRDGYILTNNHVVAGATDIEVTFHDHNELKAKVVGTDPQTDLALLKVESSGELPAARLGDSDSLEVGEWVMAIGNPFGLEYTVTVGVLSGKGRVIGAGPYDNFLQTDASINPGNSGGPLFNIKGEVVGINTAIIASGQGIGFAIPINLARSVVDQLREKGRVVRGFLGLGIQDLTPALRRALNLPSDLKGALVASVVPGGPGDRAGVQVQDVVVGFDGRPVTSQQDLLFMAAAAKVGSTVTLEVYRDGARKSLKVTVAERPDEVAAGTPQEETTSGELGFDVQELTPRLAERLGTDDPDGVVVTRVRPGSAAARGGLQAGDIIRRVNTERVRNRAEFRRAVSGFDREGVLALLVERGGNTVFLVLEK